MFPKADPSINPNDMQPMPKSGGLYDAHGPISREALLLMEIRDLLQKLVRNTEPAPL